MRFLFLTEEESNYQDIMNMKKTLIALAVAASAAVSGSAMAWEVNGTGGSVNIGGSLTPADNITPWEVQTGAAVTGLDSEVSKGQSVINLAVNTAIPILGIRSVEANTFQGAPGITPQIDYGNAVDVSAFSDGRAPLTLEVKDTGNNKIGTLTTTLSSGAELSWSNHNASGKKVLFADKAGKAFWGGLGQNAAGVSEFSWSIVNNVNPEFVAHYQDQGAVMEPSASDAFDKDSVQYSGFYGAGIESGKVLKISLDSPVQGDAPIVWKASLPVVVSYQ